MQRLSTRRAERGLLGALFLACLLLSCSKREERPTQLFAGLKSRQTPEQVQNKLGINNWEVLEHTELLKTDPRPPYKFLKVMVRDYSHHGVAGTLVLAFYNDRLVQTMFYPADLDKLRDVLRDKDKLNFSGQLDTRIEPNTKVWIGKDDAGRSYVGWQDMRLHDEQMEWIKKHAS
jgi:hypothetical protein